MKIKIPSPKYSLLKTEVSVVPAEFPLLLGRDVLENDKLLANKVQNQLQGTHHGWSMPFIREHG